MGDMTNSPLFSESRESVQLSNESRVFRQTRKDVFPLSLAQVVGVYHIINLLTTALLCILINSIRIAFVQRG